MGVLPKVSGFFLTVKSLASYKIILFCSVLLVSVGFGLELLVFALHCSFLLSVLSSAISVSLSLLFWLHFFLVLFWVSLFAVFCRNRDFRSKHAPIAFYSAEFGGFGSKCAKKRCLKETQICVVGSKLCFCV